MIRHPYNPLNLMYNNSCAYHPNWYKQKLSVLFEKQHFFQGNISDEYRIVIKRIVHDILTLNHLYTNVQLYADDTIPPYLKFVFLNPFKNVSMLNVISKLQIYVNYVYDYDEVGAYTLAAKYDALEEDYNPDEWPLYVSNGTTVQLMSIVLNIHVSKIENQVISILSHELRHTLDYIGDKKLASKVDKESAPYDTLIKLLQYTTASEDFNLYGYAANCVYYSQETEVNAHIETTINDFKSNHYTKEEALLLCKYPGISIGIIPEIYKEYDLDHLITMHDTFATYTLLKYKTEKYLKKVDTVGETSVMKNIAELLHKQSFREVLLKWETDIELYFKHLSSLIFTDYENLL